MADIQQKTTSTTQFIVSSLRKILGPFALPGQKAIRDEYLKSLGLDPQDKPDPETGKIDAFLAKKAEEADEQSFNEAMAQINTIIVSIEDIIQSAVNASSFKQGAKDIVTALLNMLTIDYMRQNHPILHNVFFMLQTTHSFSNRSDSKTELSMIGAYIRDFFKSYNQETSEEARRLSEGLGFLTSIFSFMIDGEMDKKNPEVAFAWDIGGQLGYEGDRIPASFDEQLSIIIGETPEAQDKRIAFRNRQFAEHLLNRTLSISVDYSDALTNDINKSNYRSHLTLMSLSNSDAPDPTLENPLAKKENQHGFYINWDSQFEKKSYHLTGDWYISMNAQPSFSIRIGGKEKAPDELTKSKFGVATERLLPPDKTNNKTLFDIFNFSLGDLSFQIEISPKDLVLRAVAKVGYSIQGTKNRGFPLKHIPEKKDTFNIPVRFSIKDGFGFDGGFIGERPPSNTPQSLIPTERDLSAPSDNKIGTLDIPIHRELGIVRFDKLHLGFDTDKGLGLSLTLDFAIKFGKEVVISIAELGAKFGASERTERPLNGGFLGYDIGAGFLPPKGAGIVIDAKVVKGGGFLYFNEKKGEYFGALELKVKNLFDLKAIGIIRTKDDAGREKFSLLILMTAEFKPVQLSFGFTLNGVGGILGLNRRANVAYLQEGLGSGVLQNILFPKDVVANMNRIISDLTTAFPISNNGFLVGLMAKIAWGTPTKITADIGLILELPDLRILLPGVLNAVFPSKKNAILKLQAAFLGVLDFKNQFIYFRADLIDSRLLSFKLTGSLALGISWGDPSVFVLSAGGFHPRFREIPSLPTLPNAFSNMQRIGLQLLDTQNPRIHVEQYFAITSNTVQIGGKAEFFYDVFSGEGGYNVYGRLEVNALFHFNPFHFELDIAAEIALRDGTDWVMGIGVYGLLEGPAPWHLKVRAKAEIDWFPDIEVELEKTWGNRNTELPPAVAEISSLLRGAIKDVRNWDTKAKQKTSVGLRAIGEENGTTNDILKLDPSGGLKFSQSVVPLDFDLQKFGEQSPDATRFSIKTVKIGEQVLKNTPVRDLFAPDMFIQLTDDERLSRPSFERMLSGFELENADNLVIGSTQIMPVTGEVSDANSTQIRETTVNLNTNFRRLVRTSSDTFKSPASVENKIQRSAYQHLSPAIADPFVIVGKEDLKPVGRQTFSSFSEAQQVIQKQAKTQRKMMQIIEKQDVI